MKICQPRILQVPSFLCACSRSRGPITKMDAFGPLENKHDPLRSFQLPCLHYLALWCTVLDPKTMRRGRNWWCLKPCLLQVYIYIYNYIYIYVVVGEYCSGPLSYGVNDKHVWACHIFQRTIKYWTCLSLSNPRISQIPLTRLRMEYPAWTNPIHTTMVSKKVSIDNGND